jgi:hypothetical protein
MSEVVAELIRRGLVGPAVAPSQSRRGMPTVSVGRPITAEDVRALDDE